MVMGLTGKKEQEGKKDLKCPLLAAYDSPAIILCSVQMTYNSDLRHTFTSCVPSLTHFLFFHLVTRSYIPVLDSSRHFTVTSYTPSNRQRGNQEVPYRLLSFFSPLSRHVQIEQTNRHI